MSLAPAPLLDFSFWSFLTTPLDELLDKLDARVTEVVTDDEDFLGGIIRRDWGLQVAVPARDSAMAKEITVRGVLAYWFGVDTTDWPMGLRFVELDDAG
ncbi:hypothetical protein ACIQVR_40995 [Streptomyces xanthochromogenes]|uniref:hypothetical protein n=1 Tax=Streptomyces xanthochromogenes TaxID=67384 RepID=UPI00382F8ED6